MSLDICLDYRSLELQAHGFSRGVTDSSEHKCQMNRGENIDMNMNNNMELTDLERELFHKDDKKEEIDTGSTEYIVSFNSSKVAKIDKEIIRVALENFVMNMLSDLSISCTIENKKEL